MKRIKNGKLVLKATTIRTLTGSDIALAIGGDSDSRDEDTIQITYRLTACRTFCTTQKWTEKCSPF